MEIEGISFEKHARCFVGLRSQYDPPGRYNNRGRCDNQSMQISRLREMRAIK